MDEQHIRPAIEAILFANGASVELSRIAQALEISDKQAREQTEALMADYNAQNRGITIIRLKDSYQMVTVKEYAPQIRTVMDLRRNTPLSQAALEVLAVVAYNQPVTKAFVEQVRGVDCSGVIGSLTAKGLVEEKGRLELPGRPLLYGTTEHFLRCFNISSLDELPPLPESEDDKARSDENSADSDNTENNENNETAEE
ncbi:MAG: SMC-Scp complex subunit ScpB [Ruminococcus sp.]|nr:SMC-Scp complex subunit ScpB [Ruminococcus sp.]